MAVIKFTEFHGLSPRTSDLLLGPTDATVATNVKLRNKTLKSWKAPLVYRTLGKTANMQAATESTIYYYTINDVFLHWDSDVDVVSGQHDDVHERVYYTDGVEPKITWSVIAGGQGTAAPLNSYTLGLPAPSSAPLATEYGTPGAAVDDETITWVYTYVSGKGEEGPPSNASNSLTIDIAPVADGKGYAILSNFDATPTGGTWDIDKLRLYRLTTSTSGTTTYNLVEERAASLGSVDWQDDTLTSALGEVIPSTTWDMPEPTMQGLVAMPNEFMVGFFGRTLAFSEPGYPHAWPTVYELKLDYDIVALGVYGETVVVATEGNPYLAHGIHPSTISLTKQELDQACVSKRSMVDMGTFVIYASPDGLIMAGSGQARIITEKFFTKEEWEDYYPETIIGAKQDNLYIGAYYNGVQWLAFVMDPDSVNPSFVNLGHDHHFIGRYNDLRTDTLYLHRRGSGAVDIFDSGTDSTYIWRSKRFRSPNHRTASCAQVFALGYPLTFRFYADDVLRYTKTVVSDLPFRLPGGFRSRDFQVELEGTVEVRQVFLASKMEELSRA